MGIFSSLFGKDKCLFIGNEISEPRPQKCISTLKELETIAKNEKLEVLLCESSGWAGHFLIGTQTDLIYVYAHNTFMHTMSMYPYDTINGITLQSKGTLKYVTIGLMGAQNITTGVYCSNEDFSKFYNLIINLIKQNKEKTQISPNSNLSIADELIKYKQLLDAGAITMDDYQTLKNKLINTENK